MYRILIVDDEDYVRDLLVKNIRSSSLEVQVAAAAGDGREALKSALLYKPDIVITDIAMPFMNGLELIKEMQKAGLHSKNVVISGYDEFQYARQAISLGVKDYLLKPFLPRELMDVIRKMIQELDSQKALQQNMSLLREQALNRTELAREKFLKILLEGKECPRETEEECREFGIQLSGGCYLAGVIRLSGGSWDFGRQENIEKFLLLIRDGYFSQNTRMYAVSFDGVRLAAIWCGMGENENVFMRNIKRGLEKILSSLKKYYQIQLSCALGQPCIEMKDLARSYGEAMAVWRGTLEAEYPVLIYREDGKGQEETTGNQMRDYKNRIRLAVRTGQVKEACLHLNNLMKCYASLSNKKNDYISISAGELIYAIQNDMESWGYAREEVDPAVSMKDKINYGSLMEIKEMLEGYIEKCCAVVCEHREETRAEVVVKRIKQLIDEYLKNSDADLEWAAKQVHFSASYVRQIFKQHTGESFGEYLIRKRMEQAGTLLQKTGLRIQEVAIECGYDNQRYFASSFKKFYGCTPTEFKKIVEKELS